ncbi:hypothetical protein EWD52_23495 [Salmonella enterica subsp. enterica serovar Braenderup]|nr:hypothetical protein [Salmonella enterica subsp. enterica serovar Braenderup]ECD1500264.1 hypothetical protein [Salmonella enterica subsp. enterica serovar Braenderup]
MNDKTPNLLTIGASALNQKVKDTVSGITSGEKTLVALVAVIADRWFGTDKGGVDVVQNFVNALSDYPVKQKQAARLFRGFLPVQIIIDEAGKATVENEVKLSALTDEQKATLKAAIDAFKAANFSSLAAATKPQTGTKEPKKLDLLTTTDKTAKAVNKVLDKAVADGVDRAAALNSLAAWVDSEIKKLAPVVDKAA